MSGIKFVFFMMKKLVKKTIKKTLKKGDDIMTLNRWNQKRDVTAWNPV